MKYENQECSCRDVCRKQSGRMNGEFPKLGKCKEKFTAVAARQCRTRKKKKKEEEEETITGE